MTLVELVTQRDKEKRAGEEAAEGQCRNPADRGGAGVKLRADLAEKRSLKVDGAGRGEDQQGEDDKDASGEGSAWRWVRRDHRANVPEHRNRNR